MPYGRRTARPKYGASLRLFCQNLGYYPDGELNQRERGATEMGKLYSVGLFVVSIIVLFALSVGTWPLPSAGPQQPAPPQPTPELSNGMNYPLTAQLVISAVLLIAALFVILTKRYAAQDKHWAYGALGTVVGFWLKTPG
jgi:hypothetical protein